MLELVILRVLMVAFFILANSFFVAAEFAIVSVRETRMQQLLALNRPGARTALALKHNIDEFLPAVQFGVTLASLALGWLGEPAVAGMLLDLAARWFAHLPAHAVVYAHGAAIVVSFAAIIYFEVLLGELVPKSLALARTERIALAVAGPMDVFIRMTRPAVRVMNASAVFVLRIFRAPASGEGSVHSPEEIKMIATATRRMGLLPAFQEEIIHRAIELNHVTVREIMTPRRRIFSLAAGMTVEHASARIVEEQHSRVPVYEDRPLASPESVAAEGMAAPLADPDRIIGVVYSKDISRLMHFRAVTLALGGQVSSANTALTLRQVMRDVFVVPETKLAVELLQEFQQRRRQIAVVVDEFGSTVGIVTAEDVLEQVVGELEDEFDIAARAAGPDAEGIFELDGSTTLRDLGTQLGWVFPREAGVETLAGFLLTQLGHLPVVGESVSHGGRRFIVEQMAGRRIARIRVEIIASESAASDSGLQLKLEL
ncbi:MAG TPA: hemolysin family protein [Acidobacteriaceae bacterium]